MPNAATLSSAVDTATKCLATAPVRASSVSSIAPAATSPRHSQSRASRALVSVSSVPKVLDATTNSVVVGSRSLVFSAMSVGSMFDTNRTSRPSCTYGLRASCARTGPRSEPPMPMFTTVATRSPVTPVHSPERTLSANAATFASTSCTSASTSWPSTTRPGSASAGRRSAVCSTARSSVTLMCSPANIASSRALRPTWSARATSRDRVSSVTRFFDRSTVRSASCRVRRVARSGSASNQPRRSGRNASSCAVRAVQAPVVVASTGAVTACPSRKQDPTGHTVSRPGRWASGTCGPPGSAQGLAHQRGHLGAQQLDRPQALPLRHAAQVHLEDLPVVPERGVQRDDAVRDLVRRADEVRPALRGLGLERDPVRDGEPALGGDPAHRAEPVREEELPRLLRVVGDEPHAGDLDALRGGVVAGLRVRGPVEPDQRGEVRGPAADDRVGHGEAEPAGAVRGRRVAAGGDRDPQVRAEARLVERPRQDLRGVQRGPEPAGPGDRVAAVDPEQQPDLLVEQLVVVVQRGAEQRVRLDERPPPREQLDAAD